MQRLVTLLVWGLAAGAAAAAAARGADMPSNLPDLTRLQQMSARFAPVDIGADLAGLPPAERAVLAHLVEASRLIDAIFLRQAWSGNAAMLLDLLADESPLGRARLRYFLINKGPWSRLDEEAAFVPGAPARPPGANFYPSDATKAEIAAWIERLPEAERARATGFFWTIRRTLPGAPQPFQAVPYSLEYQGELERAALLLRAAAARTAQPTLRRFLETRAAAFLSNDYYESDVAWMELDASIEPTIGPYEVYEDEWFNYKAAFESFVAVRDEAATSKLAAFSSALQDIEDHLPIEPALRNPKLGALAPIRVVNLVLGAGDGNRGVQTAAFNLPNDERVIREKGAKRVMLKNVQEAKFRVVLQPIAGVALAEGDRPHVTFDAFFTHILMHELMHGLGPHDIRVDGRATTVRQALEETYSAIEEAKADISGLWALQYLVDRGQLPRELQQTMYTTFLASGFRSIRFGITEAHARGVAIQLNRLLDAGAVRVASDGTFAVVGERIREAVTALTRELMQLQARGGYDQARALIETQAVVRPEVQRVLDRLSAVPVDIAPRFTTAEALEQELAAR